MRRRRRGNRNVLWAQGSWSTTAATPRSRRGTSRRRCAIVSSRAVAGKCDSREQSILRRELTSPIDASRRTDIEHFFQCDVCRLHFVRVQQMPSALGELVLVRARVEVEVEEKLAAKKAEKEKAPHNEEEEPRSSSDTESSSDEEEEKLTAKNEEKKREELAVKELSSSSSSFPRKRKWPFVLTMAILYKTKVKKTFTTTRYLRPPLPPGGAARKDLIPPNRAPWPPSGRTRAMGRPNALTLKFIFIFEIQWFSRWFSIRAAPSESRVLHAR